MKTGDQMSDDDDDTSCCDVCGSQGNVQVGPSGMGPVSCCYCQRCIEHNAEPLMLVATRIWLIGGPTADLDELANVATFADGHYVGLKAVLARYDDRMESEIRENFYGADESLVPDESS